MGINQSQFKIHCKMGSPAFIHAVGNAYTFVLM